MSNDINRLARAIEALSEFDPDGQLFWYEYLESLEARQLLFHVAGSEDIVNPEDAMTAANIPCESTERDGVWVYTPDDQGRAEALVEAIKKL